MLSSYVKISAIIGGALARWSLRNCNAHTKPSFQKAKAIRHFAIKQRKVLQDKALSDTTEATL